MKNDFIHKNKLFIDSKMSASRTSLNGFTIHCLEQTNLIKKNRLSLSIFRINAFPF